MLVLVPAPNISSLDLFSGSCTVLHGHSSTGPLNSLAALFWWLCDTGTDGIAASVYPKTSAGSRSSLSDLCELKPLCKSTRDIDCKLGSNSATNSAELLQGLSALDIKAIPHF